jgi:hypothetical protein
MIMNIDQRKAHWETVLMFLGVFTVFGIMSLITAGLIVFPKVTVAGVCLFIFGVLYYLLYKENLDMIENGCGRL